MTDREKLIELIHDGCGCPDGRHPFGDVCDGCKYFPSLDCGTERLADYLLANGVTFAKDINFPSKWISIEDELPESLVPVLVCDTNGDVSVTWHYSHYGHPFNIGPNDLFRFPITHWMPLPEAPKEN